MLSIFEANDELNLLLFLSITIAIRFSSRFFVSINNLISASNEIGKGNLDIKVPELKADREIELLNNNFNAMIEKLKNSKDAVEIDGALMLKADELRAMIKSNGDLTYFASDLAYHDKKLNNYELVIDIWGADHHGYVPRIREGLKKLGHDDSKLLVKLIQFANLYKNKEKISMSTRKGTFVTL